LRLRWTRLAERDLEEIAQYIGQDSPAAAARVVLELIDQAEKLLPGNPAIGRPGRVLGTRELVIGQLPYIVAYRVRDKDLEVLRVLHTSRAWPAEI
jgi:toxin ParE1/3/4